MIILISGIALSAKIELLLSTYLGLPITKKIGHRLICQSKISLSKHITLRMNLKIFSLIRINTLRSNNNHNDN